MSVLTRYDRFKTLVAELGADYDPDEPVQRFAFAAHGENKRGIPYCFVDTVDDVLELKVKVEAALNEGDSIGDILDLDTGRELHITQQAVKHTVVIEPTREAA